MKTTL